MHSSINSYGHMLKRSNRKKEHLRLYREVALDKETHSAQSVFCVMCDSIYNGSIQSPTALFDSNSV